VVIFGMFVWSPWVTNEFAVSQVKQYLGSNTIVYQKVVWIAFGKEVILPNGQGYYVGSFGVFGGETP
jgi:hypothetical protein